MNQNLVKWTGTIAIVLSSTIISLFPRLASNPWTFSGYLIGACLWLWYSIKIRDWAMIALNAFYIAINSFGIWTRL